MAATPKKRTYGAAHFALEIDGDKKAGIFHSVEGGGIKAEIKTHQTGNQLREWSQIGFPKYEDVKVEVGMAMSQGFYDWIAAFFRGETIRKTGAILAGDFHFKERARREMFEILISEVSLPTLDANSKGDCHMGVTLVPERVVFKPGSDQPLEYANFNDQKLWTPNNFSVTIDGFDDACKRISKVEGFAIKTTIHEHRVGQLRDAIRVPGRLELPTLAIHVPEADAESMIKHFVRHTQAGATQPAPRLTGEIIYLDQGLKPLCSIAMAGLDISAITHAKADSKSDDIKTVKVEFSLEAMAFTYGTNSRAAS